VKKVRKYIAVLKQEAEEKFLRKITIFYYLIDFTLGVLRGGRLKKGSEGKTLEMREKEKSRAKVSKHEAKVRVFVFK
jgi:hypothetical protein